MIYYFLQAISITIFGIVTTIWMVEETLINLMMRAFLFMLRVACHPLMIVPTMIGAYYLIRKVWLRRRATPQELDCELLKHRPAIQSPREGSYRNMGSVSSRSFDSCDYEDDEIIGSQSNRL